MDSWGDFLATPPNMSTPVREMTFTDELPQILQPPPFEIPNSILKNSSPPDSYLQIPVNNLIRESTPINTNTIEIENRCLMFKNLDPATTEIEIRQLLSDNDDIRSIDMSALQSANIVLVDFYNLRRANSVKMLFNKHVYKGRTLDVSYAPLKKIVDPKKPPNNGTIVVFHIPENVTEQMINTIFSKYGDIRQIRGTPSKGFQKFIEYWDVRCAQDALTQMNGKLLMGSRITIEFSLPGGFRKNSTVDNNTYLSPKPTKTF